VKQATVMRIRGATVASAMVIRLCLMGLVSLLAAPLPVWAQPKAKAYTIGFLGSGTSTASAAAVGAFRDGMRELGWVEGKNIIVDYRFAGGRVERLPSLAAALVREKVDLMALPSASTLAAHNATRSIPIVAVSVADPVGLGLATPPPLAPRHPRRASAACRRAGWPPRQSRPCRASPRHAPSALPNGRR
jgi:ABC-type uncharacterized transport system substrate-binding protein